MRESLLPTGSSAYFYLGVGVVALTASILVGTTKEYTIGSGPLGFDLAVAGVAGATWSILAAVAGLYLSRTE